MEYYRGSISSLRSFCRYTSHASPLSTRTLSRDIEDESFGFTLQAVIILNLARAAKVELSLCVAKGFPDMALWHSRNQSPIFLSWKIWFRPVAPYWDHRTPHRANIPAQIPIRCLSFPNHINSSPIHLPSNSPPLQFTSPPILNIPTSIPPISWAAPRTDKFPTPSRHTTFLQNPTSPSTRPLYQAKKPYTLFTASVAVKTWSMGRQLFVGLVV